MLKNEPCLLQINNVLSPASVFPLSSSKASKLLDPIYVAGQSIAIHF